MCVIAGIWGDVNESNVQSMIEAQRHRGPDGHGVHVHVNQGVLGHTRLAIMDPAKGQQPIHNEERSATLVANGMVYNHPELRRQLGDSHAFSSNSDSETILHRLILARDRIGIKPLYYSRQSQNNPAKSYIPQVYITVSKSPT